MELNFDKIKSYTNAASYFEDKTIRSVDDILDHRMLYDFFDPLGIIVMPVNNHAKGNNVWHVHVICDKVNLYNYFGVFKNRTESEITGFELAFEVLEKHFNTLVRTCQNTLPL